MFFPETGKVKVKKLQSIHNDTVVNEESKYIRSIDETLDGGTIDFFD